MMLPVREILDQFAIPTWHPNLATATWAGTIKSRILLEALPICVSSAGNREREGDAI
jgi:hypothetical protein